MSTLQLPTEKGGMGAPNFRAYYCAGQLQWPTYWLAGRHKYETGLTMEQLQAGELNRLLLTREYPGRDCPLLLGTARRVQINCLSYIKARIHFSPAIPLCGLPIGRDSIRPTELLLWEDSNLSTVGDLFENNVLIDFCTLTDDMGLHVGQFLTYGRILNSLLSL